MSDISVNADAAPDTSVDATAGGEEAFDLDAAVNEFAETAPDEWKGKASKIQKELKSLRERHTPYRDTFDGVADADREAIFDLVNTLKTGDKTAVAKWMLLAAQGVSGEQFGSLVSELTPAEKAEVAEEIQDATEEAEENGSKPLTQEDIAALVEQKLAERENEIKVKQEHAEAQARIDKQFTDLGYAVDRDENGHLTNIDAQLVAMLAIKTTKGDIQAAHEAFQAWKADEAKKFLKAHQGDETLFPADGTPVTEADAGAEDWTPLQKAKARFERANGGPAV